MQEKEYNPIGCDHKKPNGFSAWSIQSGESGSGPDIDVDVHVMVCRLCGKIKVAGRRWDGKSRHVDRFSEEFNIYHPDAIDAIIKQANFYNEDAKWQRVPAPSTDLEAEAEKVFPDPEGRRQAMKRLTRTQLIARLHMYYEAADHLDSDVCDDDAEREQSRIVQQQIRRIATRFYEKHRQFIDNSNTEQ